MLPYEGDAVAKGKAMAKTDLEHYPPKKRMEGRSFLFIS